MGQWLANAVLGFLAIAAIGAGVVGIVLWFRLFLVVIPRRMRQTVLTEITTRGWTVVTRDEHRFFSLIAERNTRRWRVKVKDSHGRVGDGKLQTSLITGLRWLELPHFVDGSERKGPR